MIGTWGGDHVRVTIGVKSSILTYDCAHGTIDQPFMMDTTGHFSLVGMHVPESGGPVHEGPPVAHPALYTGQTNGRTLTFMVTLTDSGAAAAGPYTVTLGASGHVVKCL